MVYFLSAVSQPKILSGGFHGLKVSHLPAAVALPLSFALGGFDIGHGIFEEHQFFARFVAIVFEFYSLNF